jgi:hypothetical protein
LPAGVAAAVAATRAVHERQRALRGPSRAARRVLEPSPMLQKVEGIVYDPSAPGFNHSTASISIPGNSRLTFI